jgi:CitMHS family citrate-Mg2+:H+ or citrate-Ca2+:H+ symporter
MINYPKLSEQQERIAAHAGNALAVAGMVFAAGIFTGILSGTKMVDAMGHAVVAMIPNALGPHMPVITALTSMPFTFFMSNDAYYFGILPILTEAAANYGIDPVEMGRASLLGQPVHLLSPLVPSTYLLVGMAGVNFGDHQRFTLKWACGTTIVMLIVALVTGIVSL